MSGAQVFRTTSKSIMAFLSVTFLWGLFGEAHAQIQYNNGHYMLNQLRYNPAFAGNDKGLNVMANYRGQWIGLEGAPQTPSLAVDLSIPQWSSGAGLSLTTDIIGLERRIAVELDYAYYMDIRDFRLSLGLGFGVESISIDGSRIITPGGDYVDGIDHQDDVLSNGKESAVRPLLGLGFYATDGRFSGGLSVRNLLNLETTFNGANASLDLQQGRTIHAFAAYYIDINGRFGLEPSAIFHTDLVQSQMEVSVMFNYDQFFFSGISFRGYNKLTSDALIPIVGMKFRRDFGFFYSYEVGISDLNNAANGTHEVSIIYFLGEKKIFGGGKVIHNPRFL